MDDQEQPAQPEETHGFSDEPVCLEPNFDRWSMERESVTEGRYIPQRAANYHDN